MFWVSGRKNKTAIASKLHNVRYSIGVISKLISIPKIIGVRLDPIAPAAELIPNPIALALIGKTSVAYRKNKEK